MIDFNFYAEKHTDEIAGLLDEEVPPGWTIARFIQEVYLAKLMLWSALYEVDIETGETRTRRWRRS